MGTGIGGETFYQRRSPYKFLFTILTILRGALGHTVEGSAVIKAVIRGHARVVTQVQNSPPATLSHTRSRRRYIQPGPCPA